jgi:hypothetical protein
VLGNLLQAGFGFHSGTGGVNALRGRTPLPSLRNARICLLALPFNCESGIKPMRWDESLVASDEDGFAEPKDWNLFGESREQFESEWAKVDR